MRQPFVVALIGPTMVMFILPAIAGCGGPLILPSDGGADGDEARDVGPEDGDMPRHDADDADDADDAEDALPPRPGPWTAVVSGVTIIADRICDVNGVPPNDNALMSLGAEVATDVAARLTTYIGLSLESAEKRFLLHVRECDDLNTLTDPSLDLWMFGAVDEDGDSSDDFSGFEEFFVHGEWLTTCGEPLYHSAGQFQQGALSIDTANFQLPLVDRPWPFHSTQFVGTIDPEGGESQLIICGYVNVDELASYPQLDPFGRNFLELVIFPEQVLTDPGITGVQPDIDNDGDGLEEFRVDQTTGRLANCIDGDGTVFEGRDCWSLPEIIDGFSLSAQLSLVPAVLVGCAEDWTINAIEACTGDPTLSGLCD